MLSRCFLLSTALLSLWLAGCAHKPEDRAVPLPTAPGSAPPPATLVSPERAQNAPLLTDYPCSFTDVSRKAGLQWTFTNGATGRHNFIETAGGGVAFLDYNNDGRLDIFALQGGRVPGAADGERHFSARSVLYRNEGDGTFTDVTDAAGLAGNLGYGMGVSVADYDNDGWPDLYITAYGGNRLFHNNGNGTFTDVTRTAGVADIASPLSWHLSAAWGDYDNDGHLDLFVCHYCKWQPGSKRCVGADGQSIYCAPEDYEPDFCRLYHNNGDGTFTDVTRKSGVDALRGKSMGAVWLDYDADGWPDLFVTNDSMPNFLLHNNRNGTFTDKAMLAGVAYGEAGQTYAGMGIGVGDYDRDGREDLFVVNYAGQPKSALRNVDGERFESVARAARLADTELRYLAFGIECCDYDNDGWLDLIVGNGHVQDRLDPGSSGATYAQSQQLFHNRRDGTFAEDTHSLGDLALPRVTRGLAVGDFNNDGAVDVVMVSQTGPLQLYRNDGGNINNWITFRLEGTRCNRDAYGAKVTIDSPNGRQTRVVHGSSGYCSHSDTRLTFGLRGASSVTAGEILWSGGHRQKFGALPGRRFYYVREGQPPIPDPRIAIPPLSAPPR